MKDLSEIHVIVHLFAGSGGLAELTKFESKVLPILKAHRGELLSAFNPVRESQETPDEIHHLRFPNALAFEEFKNDGRHNELAQERTKAISKTEIYVSGRLVQYTLHPSE